MSRFWRINTIWRKELVDTLRDRRTVIAMVLVPMVLYPALMLGSLQALEVQVSFLVRQEYTVAVADEAAQVWLRRVIDSDPARKSPEENIPAEELVQRGQPGRATREEMAKELGHEGNESAGRGGVRARPPPFRVIVAADVRKEVESGRAHVGILLDGPPPTSESDTSVEMQMIYDESDVRSTRFAAPGLRGVIDRANRALVERRLAALRLQPTLVRPLRLVETNIAPPEKMAGAALGQIVPLILILMTITGSIYPAIDLTAGERERGTLETLMVAPVATVELIAGKFIVVTLIGMISAVLNLLSIGGTIYLGGLGQVLTQGEQFIFPLSALPWILVLLIPMAVMFSAVLLAVCSFARSFKEAQNYIMPVMVAAMIPGVVGILPGTRLEGPILVMPVANIVVLTRDLFLGRFDYNAIALVALSTSLYAGAAVAVAAKLFGQEAVLFSDSGSIRTLFVRRFFRRRSNPSIAQALLLLALVYTLNFYIQQAINSSSLAQGPAFMIAIASTLIVLLLISPLAACWYLRIDAREALRLRAPGVAPIIAALCFGTSTWVLAKAWIVVQQRWLPMDPAMLRGIEQQMAWMGDISPAIAVVFLALVPAMCEEIFFRGFVLSGVCESLKRPAAVLVVAMGFGLFHYSAHRLVATACLGVLLGLLVVQSRSIWPAMLAHFMHNCVSVLTQQIPQFNQWLEQNGMPSGLDAAPSPTWIIAASIAVLVGVITLAISPREQVVPRLPAAQQSGATENVRRFVNRPDSSIRAE
ncbi:MAG: ABC transporter permease subunit/CPBP intramembrane protease [Phycisphaerae bacterium]